MSESESDFSDDDFIPKAKPKRKGGSQKRFKTESTDQSVETNNEADTNLKSTVLVIFPSSEYEYR